MPSHGRRRSVDRRARAAASRARAAASRARAAASRAWRAGVGRRRGRGQAARPPAARDALGGIPLPVRPASGHRDRPAAARRRTFPDAVLPDLRAGVRRGEPPGVSGRDARDERAAGQRRGPGRGLPARAPGLCGAAARRCARGRRGTAAVRNPYPGWHAGPGEMPARACRARAGRARRQSAWPRGDTCHGTVVAAWSVRRRRLG
jgi:hypothetical protein